MLKQYYLLMFIICAKSCISCSAQNAVSSDRGRISLDYFQVGDMVRSRKLSNSCKPENMDVPKGTVVGLERDGDRSGFVLVRLPAQHDPVNSSGIYTIG